MLDQERTPRRWGRTPTELVDARGVAELHARAADEVGSLVRRATWFELASATARAHRELDALAPHRHRGPEDAAAFVVAEERLRLLAGSLRGATAEVCAHPVHVETRALDAR